MAEGAGFALWAPLLVVVLAVFMFSLDMTMMNVAVSAIANDLGTEVSAVQAAIALYPLVMAALILTGAKIGDIRGA
ncbi:MAG: MFS transporter, partial [Thermoplasmata archaeon]